ncbi:MAG: alanine--tRNA ligase, partial [Ignavibacteriales bacterium CG_4_9_14_3_um_filter_30_11]
WSFGDYYKKEAIKWGWELLTKVWKLPKERLWATVYRTDDEAFDLWKNETDINPKHILQFDEKDNFWEMGETGPCGPCSEIHINLSNDIENPKLVNADLPECIEIWNLVFIQYNKDEKGKLHELPQKHVDTGMGFERVCAVLQKKSSNYDTDVFTPLIDTITLMSGVKYKIEENKIAMRVIADHIRTLTFAIADGAIPGNDGRGYVLRRILRRASRYGRKLNLKEPFLYKIVDTLVKEMSNVFPEIKEKQSYVEKIIKAEEESFNKTLDRGIELFNQIIESLKLKDENVISGKDLFMLYDTYGFPVDLTNVMAKEIGFTIDEKGFEKLMNSQKQRGRDASKDKFSSINISKENLDSFELISKDETIFTGYDELNTNSKIIGYKNENENDLIILDKTPFYVEAGGQIDDLGVLSVKDNKYDVLDVAKIDNKVVHIIESNKSNPLKTGKEVFVEIDKNRRWDIMRNHSATHFMHSALRQILGTHVHQAGSYVGPDRLRFDFTHFSKVSDTELKDIEQLVNEQLRRNLPLQHHRNTPFDKAKKMGALMFFGDKYGDKVNVVQFDDFSMEFCGGTHVKNSSEIGLFKIISESSISSGVRRIEAVTGEGVQRYIDSQLELIKDKEEKIAELLEEKKKIEKENSDLKLKGNLGQLTSLLDSPIKLGNINIYKAQIKAESVDQLKSYGDELRNKTKNSVGVLFAEIEGKVGIVCIVTDDLLKDKKLSAGKIVGELAKLVRGGGGGKPHLATAGGKDIKAIPAALQKVEEIVKRFLNS